MVVSMVNMVRIKAGLIGAGFIGPVHVEAVRRLGFVDAIALAEANQDLAERKAKQLNIPKAYGDYRDLLKNEEVEVVHNCTPNFMHFEVAKASIEAGKHVISEKPLAMTSEESAKLVELADEANVINAIDFSYRYYPLVQQAKVMVNKGELGDIYAVHGSYLQDWLLFDIDYNWRVEPNLGGESRAVADIGTHWCDTIHFVTGLKIVEVMADLKTVIPIRKKPKKPSETFTGKELQPSIDFEKKQITTEDYGSILFTLENDAKGVFTVSQVSAGRKNRLYFEVDGSKLAVAWNQEKPNQLWIGKRDTPNQLLMKDPSLLHPEAKPFADYPGGHPEAYPDALKMFMRIVYSSIANKKKGLRIDTDNFPTFADGHCEMLLVDAVLKSHKTRMWTKVKYRKNFHKTF